MRILVVHQQFLSPGQPGGSRFNEMARLWSQAGHEVTVLAGTLNYATGETPGRSRGWIYRENDGPVSVWRCHVPSSYTRSYAGRMWAFLGFTLTAGLAAVVAERPDVVIATSPPLVTAIPGWLCARLRHLGVPWVFEVRDLWPESAITTGVLSEGSLLTSGLFLIERAACRSATRINVLTPAFRDNIVERGLAPPDKIVLVPNGADTSLFQPGTRDNDVRRELGWGERFVAMYAGAHGRANALGQLVHAAERLRDRADILIALVGDGPERPKLEVMARDLGLENIVFCGAQPKERMPAFVRACDLGVAVLQNNSTFRTVYPNKVFDYMASERPVLLGIDGAARELVCDQAQAGVYAEPENAEALAKAIVELADQPDLRTRLAASGRKWVLANATRESLAERYLALMQDLVLEHGRGKAQRSWSLG